jgi:beta-glucosidase
MNPELVGHEQWGGYTVVSGDYDAAEGGTRPPVPAGTEYALLRVEVSNAGARRELFFGGANPEELDFLAFSDMAQAQSWKVFPSLDDLGAVMNEVGPEKTILSIYFRQPYVLDEASGMRSAGAILATFGVSDAAMMDIVTGRFTPTGKLPFALANDVRAITEQAPDAPGYDPEDTLFPFGHGLSY